VAQGVMMKRGSGSQLKHFRDWNLSLLNYTFHQTNFIKFLNKKEKVVHLHKPRMQFSANNPKFISSDHQTEASSDLVGKSKSVKEQSKSVKELMKESSVLKHWIK